MSDGAYQCVTLAGVRIAYRSAGAGPAIVLIKNNRRPLDLPTAEALTGRFRVFQVHPVGFGASERPEAYDFGSIDAQVLAVLDSEGVDRFVVWGFSQPGVMAAMVARATNRAVALIVGGGSLIGHPTDATLRRLELVSRVVSTTPYSRPEAAICCVVVVARCAASLSSSALQVTTSDHDYWHRTNDSRH